MDEFCIPFVLWFPGDIEADSTTMSEPIAIPVILDEHRIAQRNDRAWSPLQGSENHV